MRTLKDIEIDGKRVFIRCDFNVPKDEFGNITDDRRIRSALQTIRYCIDRDCKVILASHYERPEPGKYEEKYSLKPVAKRLNTLLKIKNEFFMAEDVIGPDAREKAAKMKGGDVLLLENLRYEAGETDNDEAFAKELASFADIYVNDAFGACHRKHASIYAIAEQFDIDHKAAGFLVSKEVNFFGKVLENPIRPFVAVVGGSKVSGKLQALCYKADIEAALRTPGFGGFQLLDLHDFPGQGTALVGVLDAFWEEKGYISPEEYRRFCNETVPLTRFSKRIFKSGEKFNIDIEVSHFGEKELQNITPKWKNYRF
jgi:3-phosphoglycerate kinase